MQTHVAMSNSHKADHWSGKYGGEEGAICASLFILLSTLYGAMKGAPSKLGKCFIALGILVLYVTIRTAYDVARLSPPRLDILASVSRRLGMHRHAIRCGETALGPVRHFRYENAQIFTTHVLLIAGLMRDHDAVYAADQPGSQAHSYWNQLRNWYGGGKYDPPEQEVRVLRALAWFANKYAARDHSDAKRYAQKAHALATTLGADDQVAEIRREFGHLLND